MITRFFQRRKIEACTARGHEYDRFLVTHALAFGDSDVTTWCHYCRSRLVFLKASGVLTIPPWLP